MSAKVIELDVVERIMVGFHKDCDSVFDSFRAMIDAICPNSNEKTACLASLDNTKHWFDKAFPDSFDE